MKRTFFTELAYVLGIVILAIGTAFMEKADLGMSMVVTSCILRFQSIRRHFPLVWQNTRCRPYCCLHLS